MTTRVRSCIYLELYALFAETGGHKEKLQNLLCIVYIIFRYLGRIFDRSNWSRPDFYPGDPGRAKLSDFIYRSIFPILLPLHLCHMRMFIGYKRPN